MYYGMRNVPGAPGNLMAGNPFGSDFVIPQQRKTNPAGGPQLNPLQQPPARIFPKDQPGREGAIDVQFRQANFLAPGMPFVGNMGGMLAQNPYNFASADREAEQELINNVLYNERGGTKFNPQDLNVQPRPGYNLQPGYNPTSVPLQRDRFILFNPRSGVA